MPWKCLGDEAGINLTKPAVQRSLCCEAFKRGDFYTGASCYTRRNFVSEACLVLCEGFAGVWKTDPRRTIAKPKQQLDPESDATSG